MSHINGHSSDYSDQGLHILPKWSLKLRQPSAGTANCLCIKYDPHCCKLIFREGETRILNSALRENAFWCAFQKLINIFSAHGA